MNKYIYALLISVFSLMSPLSWAQVPPDAVMFTDLSCHRLDEQLPPLDAHLFLQHLNPLIAGAIEEVDVLQPRQLCTPVRKNSQEIPPHIIDFISYLDLKCYQVQGHGVFSDVAMILNHLNPLFSTWAPEFVQFYDLTQLCVPVNKLQDGVIPQPIPDGVIDFVSNVDLACYRVFDQNYPIYQLRLTDLNPMFTFGPTSVTMYNAREFCLPVQKSFDPTSFNPLPPDVLDAVSQIDLLKYDIFGDRPDYNYFLGLRHLNPVLAGFPDEQVLMHEQQQLMVPVAKNWAVP